MRYKDLRRHMSTMKSGEMKRELESYGVDTKSMFDKAEFENALLQARFVEATSGVEQVGNAEATAKTSTNRKTSWGKPRTSRTKKRDKWSSQAQAASVDTEIPREQKYDNAFQEGVAMKISELKQELKDRGVSTAAFFEKVDMAKAYAEAIADNVFKKKNRSTKNSASSSASSDEVFDPSYRDVNVEPFNAGLTILPGDAVIDITDF
ncbi:MAG: hypothetical protein SGARI_001897, partial [Bacillariaceae sp.]